MNARMWGAAAGIAGLLGVAGCAGGAKQADSPGACPDGTILKGTDCVPEEGSGDDSSASSGSTPHAASSGGGESAGGGTYDKDHVDVELKRAARQVKGSCGGATDNEGHATGPWGQIRVNVVLGRNGHVKGVTVPPPYDTKPVGICIAHAFEKIQFPPYAGSTDVAVDWDVEVSPPKK